MTACKAEVAIRMKTTSYCNKELQMVLASLLKHNVAS